MTISEFAPGKLILMGEHAVVYGHSAVAMAVNRGTTITLSTKKGPTALTDPALSDKRIMDAIHSVLPDEGLSVHIETNLPIGRGMGSSAALAVALARASLRWKNLAVTDHEVNQRAFDIERIFHGNPSGVDHTVSMRGGAMKYRKSDGGPQFERIAIPPLPLVVIDSGSAGDTATMVNQVRERLDSVQVYIDQIGELVESTLPAMKSGDLAAVGQAWHENHLLLRAIGVSNPTLDNIVRMAEDLGAHGAKLAGAGGGGVVIALTNEPEAIVAKANTKGWTAFEIFSHP